MSSEGNIPHVRCVLQYIFQIIIYSVQCTVCITVYILDNSIQCEMYSILKWLRHTSLPTRLDGLLCALITVHLRSTMFMGEVGNGILNTKGKAVLPLFKVCNTYMGVY